MDRANVYRSTLRYFFAPVADLLYDDETVSEVLINGPDRIYCERKGRLERVERRFADEAVLTAAVRNLAEYVRRDLHSHSLDARLPEPEQFRVHIILPPAPPIILNLLWTDTVYTASSITSLNWSPRLAYRRLLIVSRPRLWAIAFGIMGLGTLPGFALGWSLPVQLSVVLGVALITSAVTDLLWRRIFNWVTGPAFLFTLALTAVYPDPFTHVADALIGAVICFTAMLVMYFTFGGGEGDVKLLAVIGAALGAYAGFEVLVVGHLLAAAFALLLIFMRSVTRIRQPSSSPLLAGSLPMAPFFAAAYALLSIP